jgi:tetratricopeptide (TPR) repeat protein
MRTNFSAGRFFLLFFCLTIISAYSQTKSDSDQYFFALSLSESGEYDKALQIFKSLNERYPNDLSFFQSLVNTYNIVKDYQSAVKLLKPKYEKNKNDMLVVQLLGKTYYHMGKENETFELWDDFLLRNPNDPTYCRTFSFASAELRSFDHAVDYMKKGKAINQDKIPFCFDLSNLYLLTMAYKNAAQELVEILKINQEQLDAVFNRLSPFLQKREVIDELKEPFEKNANANYAVKTILAKLYAEADYHKEAFAAYKELDESQKKNGIELFNFAQQLSGDGKFTEAAEVYKYLLNTYPASPMNGAIKLNNAKALENIMHDRLNRSAGNWKPLQFPVKLQIESYKEIIEAYNSICEIYKNSDPAVEAQYRKAWLYAQAELNDSAKAYYNGIIKQCSTSRMVPEACEGLANLLINDNQLDSALAILTVTLNRSQSTLEQKNEARMNSAYIWFYKNNFDQSRKMLSEIVKSTRDDETNDAIELSMLLNTAMNDSTGLTYYSAILNKVARRDIQGIDELCAKITKLQNQFFLKSVTELKQAEIKIATDDLGSAIAFINEILKQKTNIFADKANFYLGQIYQYGLKDSFSAIKTYETFLEDYPSSIYADKVREEIKTLRTQAK